MSASNAAVREMPDKTLYEVEDDLLSLLDSEEGVPAELEEQFRADLAAALIASKDKRERSARGILQDESSAAFARKEAQRIGEWARGREARAERKRAYVLNVIQQMDRDKKGKFQKLEAHTVTMSARACPASLEITDQREVPVHFKEVSFTLRGETWLRMLPLLPRDIIEEVFGCFRQAIDSAAVKAALAHSEVPGADLLIGKYTLQVK